MSKNIGVGFNKVDDSNLKEKEAEAIVSGILRGGKLVDGVFIFHAGTALIETKQFELVRVFDEV